MDPDIQELITVLEDLANLLEADGNEHWATWARKGSGRLLNSDYAGIEYVLSGYGGMGSFNDIILGQSYDGGDLSSKRGHIEENERFNALRSRAWELAGAIRQSQS